MAVAVAKAAAREQGSGRRSEGLQIGIEGIGLNPCGRRRRSESERRGYEGEMDGVGEVFVGET